MVTDDEASYRMATYDALVGVELADLWSASSVVLLAAYG